MGFSINIGMSTNSGGGGGPSPLLNSLISYWKLDEASGTRNDSVGTNHLTDNNTVTQSAGKVGNAGQFTAANLESLSVADNASLRVTGVDFTVAGWFWFDATGLATIYNKGGTWTLFTRTNQIEWRVFDGSFFTAIKAYAQAANTWYFMLCDYNAATKTASADVNNSGTPATIVSANPLADDVGLFSIGLTQAGFGYLNGRADEFGFWKRLLTPAEKAQLYNSGSGRTYPF